MSKHRKHRGSRVDASTSTPPLDRVQSQPWVVSSTESIARRVVWQLAGVLGASIVLGFAFNASSPVGVRFSDVSSIPATLTTSPTNPVVTVTPTTTTRIAGLPLTPPPPTGNAAVKPAVIPAPKPTPDPAATPVSPPPTSSPVAVPKTPPVIAATPATLPAVLNPAPIHWSQAEPLLVASQAVLVDVRARGMYDAGHIPGAFSLPEGSSPEEFTTFLNQQPTNLMLIVYCSSVSCSQSARVANRLVTQFQRPLVRYMTGGYLEYQQAKAAKLQSGTAP